jgi:hypothetical protein
VYPSADAEKTIAAFTTFLAGAGFEPYFGRRLPSMLRRLGLTEVDAVGRSFTYRGASNPLEPVFRQTFARLLPGVLAAGLLTQADVDSYLARLADPGYDFMTSTLVSAWGHTPDTTNDNGE